MARLCGGCGKPIDLDSMFCLDCEVKMLEGKKTPDEELRIKANEIMLNSKGFMLFAMSHTGLIEAIGDTTQLTTIEQLGLEYYIREFDPTDEANRL